MQAGIDFVHVIMTRFNLATPGRESRIRNQPGWLAERFELFERYCLPSLEAQTSKTFRWIIYFDDQTPEPFRARIEVCRRVQEFTPYFTSLFPGSGWPRSVRELLAPDTPWLLSTRLDNDDGLAVDFVERLHAAVARQAQPCTAAFNFTNGFLLEGDRIYAHAHPSNAFASWFEPWNAAARTAPSIQHMTLAEHGPIVQIDGPGAWLQVVHGGNVSNKTRGRRVGPAEARGRFPAEIQCRVAEASRLELLAETVVRAPLRAGRDAALALLRRR